MGNLRLDFAIWNLTMAIAIIVFPIALAIYALSSCDVRRRGDKHACRDGSAAPCLAVGHFYEERAEGLVATMLSNATTAKHYYERACELGNTAGCARFGHMMVVGSYDVMKDDDFSRADGMAALDKACTGGELAACNELVEAAEPAQAAVVLAKLCDRGDKPSCDKLVIAYVRIGDTKSARELIARLCDAGDEAQCRDLGTALLAGNRLGEPDPARGIALLTKICEHGTWAACRDLADAYLAGTLPADPARAGELLAKACDHNDLDACFEEGKLVLASDPTKAVQIFTAECEHDDRGCDALGDVYRVGVDGVARDRNRARSFYSTACRAGSEFDCAKLKCFDSDSDSCYKVKRAQRERRFRLGGAFDMK